MNMRVPGKGEPQVHSALMVRHKPTTREKPRLGRLSRRETRVAEPEHRVEYSLLDYAGRCGEAEGEP